MIPDPLGGRPHWQQAAVGFCALLVIIIAFALTSGLTSPALSEDPAHGPVHVRILAINDFHGQLPAGQNLNQEPAGSIPVLASYLKAAMAEGVAAKTFIALTGDTVGASPPESGLLLDEPAILFWNGLARGSCMYGGAPSDPSCNLVSTFGNHEFDKGVPELLRKISGGNSAAQVTHLVDPYPGAKAGYVCSNVVWKANGTPLAVPFVIRDAGGARIAFIGADTVTTALMVRPADQADIDFLDEAGSINRYVPAIQNEGVHAIAVLLHEGGRQDSYDGLTQEGGNVSGRLPAIVANLDPDVDIVLSGHTHQFTNAYLPNRGGRPVLVTQAYSYSRAFAKIDCAIDPVTNEITEKTAVIVPAYGGRSPGTSPDPDAAALLAQADKAVAPLTDRVVATVAADITRTGNSSGESALGNLVADAQREAMKTDIAFVTIGSIRNDIPAGKVTWGDLYEVQPYSSSIVSVTMSGEQVKRALERQWEEPVPPYNLAVSGLSYTFDERRPVGSRVTGITVGDRPSGSTVQYTAAMADYLASGGDGYTVFTRGTNMVSGPLDVEALVSYVGSRPQPVHPPSGVRITKDI